jgi:hypothetical protein
MEEGKITRCLVFRVPVKRSRSRIIPKSCKHLSNDVPYMNLHCVPRDLDSPRQAFLPVGRNRSQTLIIQFVSRNGRSSSRNETNLSQSTIPDVDQPLNMGLCIAEPAGKNPDSQGRLVLQERQCDRKRERTQLAWLVDAAYLVRAVGVADAGLSFFHLTWSGRNSFRLNAMLRTMGEIAFTV